MGFIIGVMLFFLIIGFLDLLCNCASGKRNNADRLVDLIEMVFVFGMIIGLLKVGGFW